MFLGFILYGLFIIQRGHCVAAAPLVILVEAIFFLDCDQDRCQNQCSEHGTNHRCTVLVIAGVR